MTAAAPAPAAATRCSPDSPEFCNTAPSVLSTALSSNAGTSVLLLKTLVQFMHNKPTLRNYEGVCLRVCLECNELGFPEFLAGRTIHWYSFVECCDNIRVVAQLEGEMHFLVVAAVKPDTIKPTTKLETKTCRMF